MPVDDKFELGRTLHRQIGRFLTLEDSRRIKTDLAGRIRKRRSVTHQDGFCGGIDVPVRESGEEVQECPRPGKISSKFRKGRVESFNRREGCLGALREGD